ncbi:MAG: hypothetical protein AAGM38_17970 [Pseudomonadota bacterium]
MTRDQADARLAVSALTAGEGPILCVAGLGDASFGRVLSRPARALALASAGLGPGPGPSAGAGAAEIALFSWSGHAIGAGAGFTPRAASLDAHLAATPSEQRGALTAIGHSWGAARLAETLRRRAIRVRLLLTLDPVGRFTSREDLARIAALSEIWINVEATRRFGISNAISRVGGRWGARPAAFATRHLALALDHRHAAAQWRAAMACARPLIARADAPQLAPKDR